MLQIGCKLIYSIKIPLQKSICLRNLGEEGFQGFRFSFRKACCLRIWVAVGKKLGSFRAFFLRKLHFSSQGYVLFSLNLYFRARISFSKLFKTIDHINGYVSAGGGLDRGHWRKFWICTLKKFDPFWVLSLCFYQYFDLNLNLY